MVSRARLSSAQAALDRALALAGKAGDPALQSEALGWQGLVAAMSGRHAAARAHVDESLRLALDHDLKEQVAVAYRRRANICDYEGNYPGEHAAHLKAIRDCRASRVGGEMSCLSCLACACFRTGDWKDAQTAAKTVHRDPDAPAPLGAIAEAVLGMVSAFRGERAAAQRYLPPASTRPRCRWNGSGSSVDGPAWFLVTNRSPR